MSILAVIFGSVLILLVALDAFETIVLPRRLTRRLRLSQLFYRVIRLGWTSLGHLVRAGARRDTFLGYMGPLSFALILTGIEGTPVEPARFAFAMARHAVVDLAQVLGTPPMPGVSRLSSSDFVHLQDVLAASGIHLKEGMATEQKLAEFRETYEPFVSALATRIQVALPPWLPQQDSLDDWQTSAWDDWFPSTRRTLLKVMHRE